MDEREQVDCPHCDGTGNEPAVTSATGGPEPCDVCDGTGWIFQGEDVAEEADILPDLDLSNDEEAL